MKAVFASVILAAAPATALAGLFAQTFPQLQILEAGTYSATPKSSRGLPLAVGDPKLIKATTSIAGTVSTRFGVRYVVLGQAEGSPAKLTMITRYPGAGIRDHATKNPIQFSEYTVDVLVGRTGYRDFFFDSRSELVAGEWVFEFWSQGKKIGEQTFCVSVPEERPPVCALIMG